MATINFLYRSIKEYSNLEFRLLFRHNGKDFIIGGKTKINVSKDFFKNQRNKNTKDAEIRQKQLVLKNELNSFERFILTAFDNTNPNFVNKEWLSNQVNEFYNPKKISELPTEFIKYFDYYIEVKRTNVKKNTLKKFNVIKQLITRYQNEKNITLNIIDINLDFKIDFEKYCKENNYADNTISRAIRFLKTITLHAKSNGLETSFQLDSIKANYQRVGSIYLTFEELEKIEKTKYSESLANARDWLIISCHTGQRVSDFMRFNKSMIVNYENKKGESKQFIEFIQVKTDKKMTIPLLPKVLEILNKRNGDFPRQISDQKYNNYIKDVCKIAGINNKVVGSKKLKTKTELNEFRKTEGHFEKWELVTSHIGRRSFATNYYGSNIPTSLLINVTGHSSENMFLNYIGKSNKDKAIELTEYF